MTSTVESHNNLAGLTEEFLSSQAGRKDAALGELLAGLRQAVAGGQPEEAAAALRRAVVPTLDYTAAQSLYRIRRQLRGKVKLQRVKFAVLGSFTTKQLVTLIDLHLFSMGIEAEIYEADYGLFRQEILDPQSELYRFEPKVVFLATSWRDLANRPKPGDEAARLVAAEQALWAELWQKLHDGAGCQVIQNNFVIPAWRPFANHESRQSGSLGRFIAAMNQSFADRAPSYVTIHDADHLAAAAGRWSWDDPRFVHQAKMPCAPEFLFDYGHSIASLVAAQVGLAKKCLVLDLDNTLWGGVIGDDGLGGIRLGQGNPEGEAFLYFQEYIKGLKQRGIILAVCSKNQDETARSVFEKHPEMVLRLEDISCFVANWEDKASNLRAIARELNIGLNSLVFIDDNPAERAIVRQNVPEVAVPEVSDDVTSYIQTIERHRYFQVLSVGSEDFQRTDYYRADVMRKEAQTSTTDMAGFLGSLEMVARIGPINATSIERSAQLIQRSNQFNLTTRRRTVAELTDLLAAPSWVTCTVSLADRFGDNGLISVALAHQEKYYLDIDTWLMSCRVLKRGVEQSLLNHLASVARERGLTALRGRYVPSAKNEMVREHYAGLGFAKLEQNEDGETSWELNVGDNWKPLPHFIKEMIDNGSVAQ